MKILLMLSFILMLQSASLAQKAKVMEADIIYLDKYIGKERAEYILRDSIKVKNGTYFFESDLISQPFTQELNQLKIQGRYLNGKFHGPWGYKLSEYELLILKINAGRNIGLDYLLNGVERNAKLNYLNGIPEGQWLIDNLTVKDNQRLNERNGSFINFKQGLAVGDFGFDGFYSKNFIRGKLDEEGFLEGLMVLEYQDNGVMKKEERIYDKGFLTSLKVFSGENKAAETEIVYEDVLEKLESANGSSNGIDYSISEEGFGVLFQNGYREDDPKNIGQQKGNLILSDLVNRFQLFSSNNLEERQEPKFNFTRRFKFIYPNSEDSLLNLMIPRLHLMIDDYNEFLSNPKNILNKQSIDSLPYIFGFIDQARRKAEILLDAVNKVESGYFDYLFRPNFYPTGIVGINKSDYFSYVTGLEEKSAEFDIGVVVDSAEDLVSEMDVYSKALSSSSSFLLEYAQRKRSVFDQQETIDSLDVLIVQLKTKMDALYSFYQIIPQGKDFEELTFDYKFYRILASNMLQPLQKNYLDEVDYVQKEMLGRELTCALGVLGEQYEFIEKIGLMPESLKKDFIRFSPNPFFERQIETRILNNIYSKGTGILFNHYVEALYDAKTCDELENRIDAFRKLETKLKDLAQRSDEEDVVRRDRALRRETLPSRIERLLNL